MRDLPRLALLVEHGALDRTRSCTAKVAYPSRNDARHAAKETSKHKRVPFFTYKCAFCSKESPHWHIGRDDMEDAA